MRLFKILAFAAVFCVPGAPMAAADTPADKADRATADKILAKLAQMIGGTWVNDNPQFKVEFRYEWTLNHTALRGHGIIGKGSSSEKRVESTFGWDSDKKEVYYLDFHGGEEIYKGTVRLDGDELLFDFTTLIGKPGKYRSTARFRDPDTYEFTILGEKEGKWVPVHRDALKRQVEPVEKSQLEIEGIVNAPRDAVWAALTTKEGLEAWQVAHADVDLRVGGLMRTHYDVQGRIGDENTIENRILCLDPKHMYALQVNKPPAKFPFKNAIKNVWTVVYVDEIGPGQTRVRLVQNGYGKDDESLKLRDFFAKGNAYVLKKLQEKFAKPKGS